MTCRELADFLLDYVSGELPAAATAAFDRHLSACENCRHYLEQYRQMITAGRTAFALDDEKSAQMPEELVRAILAARREGA